MPTFNDSTNYTTLPECDVTFEVTACEAAYSRGQKTAGSETFNLTLKVVAADGQEARVFETLIDHPSTSWKIDTFIKSAGVRLNRGEEFAFTREVANQKRIKLVDPIGLRGHARVAV